MSITAIVATLATGMLILGYAVGSRRAGRAPAPARAGRKRKLTRTERKERAAMRRERRELMRNIQSQITAERAVQHELADEIENLLYQIRLRDVEMDRIQTQLRVLRGEASLAA